jgi:cysteinyl-tRNA synthetase
MQDDLNTAAALGAMFELVRDLNSRSTPAARGGDCRRSRASTFDRSRRVSLRREETAAGPVEEIERLIEERRRARRRGFRRRRPIATNSGGVCCSRTRRGDRWKGK